MEAIREIAEGGAVMSPEVATRVVDLFRKSQIPAPSVGLSPQESRLLKLLMEGHQNKTAAAELGISVHTVSFHPIDLRKVARALPIGGRSASAPRRLDTLSGADTHVYSAPSLGRILSTSSFSPQDKNTDVVNCTLVKKVKRFRFLTYRLRTRLESIARNLVAGLPFSREFHNSKRG
jgi:hypothetical protein